MEENIYPINFCIDNSKFKTLLYNKSQAFSLLIPGLQSSYIYNNEESYYNQYSQSYYALTFKKAGWDCMRHYEIIAAGAIPFFVDLDKCPEGVMTFLPKDLIIKAMKLKGVFVNTMTIDYTIFDKTKYYKLRDQIYNHIKQYCTNIAMAKYTLDVLRKNTLILSKKILFLSPDIHPDYMKSTILPGYIHLLGRDNAIDYPKLDHIYKSYNKNNLNQLYGKGITYTRIIDNDIVDRDNITEKIINNEYSCIIYPSIHRGLPLYNLVSKYYHGRIIYICGEDEHNMCCKNSCSNGYLFLREYQNNFKIYDDYNFYPNKDYGGNDIIHFNDNMWNNYSTDIKCILGNCIENCHGFNTLGYYKSKFDSRKLNNFNNNNGLYVKKINIGFFVRHFTERGTEDALFNYAYYNEQILKNKSYIISFKKELYNKYNLPLKEDIFEKFNFYFKILFIEKFEDIQYLIDVYKLNFLYNIISGWKETFPFAYPQFSIPTLVHCVFDSNVLQNNNINNNNNNINLVISNDLNKRFGTKLQVLPHIINIGSNCNNDRKILNIPEDAIVFGRHGGLNTFDIQFVKECIIDFAKINKNVYFLFMNTTKFTDNIDNIIYLDTRIDIEDKRRFINTCDAMIHARTQGETFGLAVGEFAVANKPIITWALSSERAHLDFLSDKAILYSNYNDLYEILTVYDKNKYNNLNVYENYKQFLPINIIHTFSDIINLT
jgi:hypothetical protein